MNISQGFVELAKIILMGTFPRETASCMHNPYKLIAFNKSLHIHTVISQGLPYLGSRNPTASDIMSNFVITVKLKLYLHQSYDGFAGVGGTFIICTLYSIHM